MTVVLDAGALIAFDKRDRTVGAMLRLLQRDAVPLVTSGAVVAQAWRDPRRQANLARLLTGVHVAALDEAAGRRVGELLRANNTTDLGDAHLSLLVQNQDRILTSDTDDIRTLLRTRRVNAVIVRV
jgi:PIN domain nuclease of toxin-antitoxin system